MPRVSRSPPARQSASSHQTATPLAREFCAEVAREAGEPLAATASRVDHWIVVEYRGLWAHDAVDGSALTAEVKAHLLAQCRARPRTKLLFIRRTERRGREGLAVYWCTSPEHGGEIYGTEIDAHEDLLALDFAVAGDVVAHPLFLVCTHGKHDRCCARRGRPLYDALREQAEDDWVWQCTHIGGDRFAGNVVVLPEGLYYGRVEPADVWALVDEHFARRIHMPRYRGRCCYRFPEQAAERAVREHANAFGIDDLTLAESTGERMTFRVGDRAFDVGVEEAPGELTYLTCSAESLRHPRHYAARILRESAA